MAKVTKLKIIKPENIGWEVFGPIMREFDTLAWRIKNYALDQYWRILQAEAEYNRLNPNDKFNAAKREQQYGYKSIESYIRPRVIEFAEQQIQTDKFLQKMFKRNELMWHSEMVPGLIREAVDTYKKVQKDVFRGVSTLPTFKRGQPIPIRSRQIKILDAETLTISVLNKDGGAYFGIPKKGVSFPIQLKVASRKGYAKLAMTRLLSGEYLLADSRIVVDGKDIYLQLTHKPADDTPKQVAADKDKILGIDLGIVKAVVMQVADTPKHEVINGGEITQFRQRTENNRVSKRNQLKYASKNRHGRGRKTLLQPALNIGDKIARFRDTTNHRYSRYIVDTAIENGCGTIQMEELSGIHNRSKFLKNWSYYDLQQKVEYKAKEYGIEVKYINPKHTSQRCYKCGIIDADSRKKQDFFHCAHCGYKANADINAARNIAMKDIETIIAEQMVSQGKILE